LADPMADLVFAYPGDLETPTGGYVYDRRIIEHLRKSGVSVELVSLGEGFPFPDEATLSSAFETLLALPKGTPIVVDGLAFGVMDAEAASLARHLDLVALIHHPLYLETGLAPDIAAKLAAREKAAVQCAARIVVTSPATARRVQDSFDIPLEKISVVVPGVDTPSAPVAPAGDRGARLNLLSVGTLTRRKGHDLLFDALGKLQAHDWHLDVVGDGTRDPACENDLKSQIADLGIADRVTFHGAVPLETLGRFYAQAHIFVLASRYEGFGMAYVEAIAHGLPVIGSGGGAVRETLPDGAALYCGVEDAGAIEDALRTLITDQHLRHHMSEAALNIARALPDWTDAAAGFAAAVLRPEQETASGSVQP